MNLNDKLSQAENATLDFVLTRWHSFWGGIAIGALVMWALVKTHIL